MNTILFVDHAAAIGGAENSLLSLLEGLDRSRWTPHLACAGGELARQAAARDVPIHILPMFTLRRLRPRPWLRTVHALAWRIEADLLYANTARAALFAAPAALIARRPLVWHMRDYSFVESGPPWAWLDGLLKRLVGGCAAEVVANSHSVAARIPVGDRVRVVHNGIDPDRYDPLLDQGEARERLGMPRDRRVVGMLGRVRPWKGQETFLRMAALVIEQDAGVDFVVAGGDPFAVGDSYAAGLRRLVEELGIADRVTFSGHLEDVRPALAAMDVYVHPGEPEPFGLVNLEAMAMEKPVVAFAHGALPEIVEHGRTGLLVPPGNVEELASAVAILLRDSEGAGRLGREGAQQVRDRFAIGRTVTAIEEVLALATDRC